LTNMSLMTEIAEIATNLAKETAFTLLPLLRTVRVLQNLLSSSKVFNHIIFFTRLETLLDKKVLNVAKECIALYILYKYIHALYLRHC